MDNFSALPGVFKLSNSLLMLLGRERDVLTAGYGRQFLNGPVHSFRFEFGPGLWTRRSAVELRRS